MHSVETMLTAPAAGRAAGSMRTLTKSVSGKEQQTVLDSETGVCVVPMTTIEKNGFRINRSSDVVLSGADQMESTPMGICDSFQFRINDVTYMVRVYVVKQATFALLLGNKFLWAAGAALFPRWGAFALTIPVAQFLLTTCKSLPVVEEIHEKSSEALLHFDTRPASPRLSFPITPFLKVDVTSDVISVGERHYIEEVEEVEGKEIPSLPADDVPVFTDKYIRSRIDISPTSPSWFVDAVVSMIIKHNAVISWTYYDLGRVTEYLHDIELIPGAKGVHQPLRPYLFSPKNADIIRRKSQPLINMGIWVPTPTMDWCAQVVIAKKERVCHNFTDLNKVTVSDAYPIVPMSTIMSNLSGKGRFSVFDADRGYFQILHTPRAMRRAAFELLGRLYYSTRMLFGEVMALATFMRNMSPLVDETRELFKVDPKTDRGSDVKFTDVDNYFNDVILSGHADSLTHHLCTINVFLSSVIKRGWKFKASKIRIAYDKIKVLGVIVSATGKEPDPTKVDALLAMRQPETASEVKSWLRLAQWFGDHIPAMAWRTCFLHKMCAQQKGEKLSWSSVATNAWEYVRRMIRMKFRLAIWDPEKTTILYSDACLAGLGALITQIQSDGSLCVIAFASCALTPMQQNYHITRLEALAFIWALGHFHVYLSHRPFLWRTDHRALKFIFDASRTKIPVLQRYKLIADEYNFCTEWIEGSKMIADSLS